MLVRFLLLIGLFLFVELYSYQAFKTVIKTKWVLQAYLIISAFVVLYVTYNIFQFDRKVGQTPQSLFTLGLFLVVLLPKLVITIVMIGEDVYRVLVGNYNLIFKNNTQSFLPSRRKFVSQIGLGLAAIPFLSLITHLVLHFAQTSKATYSNI